MNVRSTVPRPWPLVALVMAIGVATVVAGQQQGTPQTRPTFTAAVDVVRVDVRVVDRRTRTPIQGLRQEDFMVTVAGDVQPLVSADEVRLAATSAPVSTSDVASNSLKAPRLIAIVMDDISVSTHPYNLNKAREIANRVIDHLEPDDLAAVIFTQNNRNAQDFTQDRDLLRKAVATFRSWPLGIDCDFHSAMVIGTVRRTVEFLTAHAPDRAAVFLVSQAPPLCGKEYFIDWSRGVLTPPRGPHTSAAAARLITVPIHAMSVAGLEAPTGPTLRISAGTSRAMSALAANSGGRHVSGTNAPEREVEKIFEEMGSYYVLGYRALYPLDGRLRWLDVKVTHPNALVLPGGRAFASPRSGVRASPEEPMPPALTEALSAALPTGNLPLRLAVAPTHAVAADAKAHPTIITLGVDLPEVELPPTLSLQIDVRAFDGEGRREVAAHAFAATITAEPGNPSRLFEIATRLDLPPGRYNIRAAAALEAQELSGGVFTTVVVPDFERDALALSGVAIGRIEGRTVAGRAVVAGILPFVPTTVREFLTTEHVGALVSVHQSTRRPASSVTLRTTIETATGTVVSSHQRSLSASEFSAGQGVPHTYELPLKTLAPGQYLLTFELDGPVGDRVTRSVRFLVR